MTRAGETTYRPPSASHTPLFEDRFGLRPDQTPVDLGESLRRLTRDVDQQVGVYEARAKRVRDIQAELLQLTEQASLMALSEAALTELLSTVSAESLQVIEQTVTYGLRTVFDDRLLAFRFVTSTQRGQTAVDPVLLYNGVEAPILDAFGGGPASVVAFLLRLLVCRQLGLYPLLLLDEAFAMVSVEYLPNLGALLKELAAKLGFTIVLVTQERTTLPDVADRAYQIVDGKDGATFKDVTV